MGIHSGPVITWPSESAENIAGAGINIAQRVMDCGDAGHILVSKSVADDLAHTAAGSLYLHELGDFEVKHGVVVSVVNLMRMLLAIRIRRSELRGSKRISQRTARSERPKLSPALIAAVVVGLMLFTLAALAIVFAPAILKQMRSAKTEPASVPAARSRQQLHVSEKSIAVLPFENLSEEKANAFFADGVQDQILTALAKIADLKVISRTSVMQ